MILKNKKQGKFHMEKTGGLTKEQIKNIIKDFISSSPLNTMEDGTGKPAWDDALVGFASDADPIWQQYKE
jgi:enolase